MKKNEVVLRIHSMVDVITNSSSVTYVTAGEGSITKVKELINSLLSFSGSDKKADDLFDFKLSIDEERLEELRKDKLADEEALDWDEVDDTYVQIEKGEREKPEWWDTCGQNEEDIDTYIRVTTKIEDKNLKDCAKILSSLEGLFSYESSYDG